MSQPQTLPLARYRYTFRMREPLRLPGYAGSLLRGQFGASLRRISCVTQQASCAGCPVRSTCPYPAVFEAPAPAQHALQRFSNIPNPYVIEPPPLGTDTIARDETLQFNLVLFGKALEHLPLVSFAMQRAIEQGLGPNRARGALERVDVQESNVESAGKWATIWKPGNTSLAAHNTTVSLSAPASSMAPSTARLTFSTPLRLQQQGQPIRPDGLTPRKLVADLLRRVTLLAEFHADRPGVVPDVHDLVRLAEGLDHQHSLSWYDWSRYSSRQEREMPLGGAIGTWTLTGELTPLLPWLRIGQWLHVGKNATLGLGAYELDTLGDQSTEPTLEMRSASAQQI